MRLNPEYQWLYFALVDNFIIKKDFENAFVTVKNELAKDPQNDAVQLKLAFTAILTLRQEVLNSALENVKKLRMSKYDDVASGRKPIFSVKELLDLAQASMEIENFSQALQFYKEIIAISTDSTERARFWKAKHHFDMAKIYLKLNDKVNAVKEAKKAADLAPLNYTEDAKKLLIQ
jgi:tetratricopeptide (TPR) repeat protein